MTYRLAIGNGIHQQRQNYDMSYCGVKYSWHIRGRKYMNDEKQQ